MKDFFSSNSEEYSLYRPKYPSEVISFILDQVLIREKAWDCATGNGQLASHLSKYFVAVEATDISGEQMKYAFNAKNINYSRQAAEKTNFPDDHFDLIVVGQAVHWFDFEKFFTEVQRVLKSEGVLAILGYGLIRSNEETNRIIDHFYEDLIGPYWSPERKFIDEEYRTLPFPFQEISVPSFEIKQKWNYEHLIGYLRTWSAVKYFQKKNSEDPVEYINKDLRNSFGEEGEIKFPLLLRVGRKI